MINLARNLEVPRDTIKKSDLAWAAGFFDGEGCILIRTHHIGDKYYTLSLKISQKRLEPLRYFSELFGGVGSFWTSKQGVHQWQCEGQKANQILKLIYPYLVIKNPEADVAFKFVEEGIKFNNRWTPERRKISVVYKDTLSAMKKEAYANG